MKAPKLPSPSAILERFCKGDREIFKALAAHQGVGGLSPQYVTTSLFQGLQEDVTGKATHERDDFLEGESDFEMMDYSSLTPQFRSGLNSLYKYLQDAPDKWHSIEEIRKVWAESYKRWSIDNEEDNSQKGKLPSTALLPSQEIYEALTYLMIKVLNGDSELQHYVGIGRFPGVSDQRKAQLVWADRFAKYTNFKAGQMPSDPSSPKLENN